jgi:hypothetical protein
MAAACPACGVPVVPGYVKCPKCHKPLPPVRTKGVTRDPGGGTAVDEPGGFPVIGIVVAVLVAGGIIAFFGLRGRGGTKPSAVVAAQPVADDDSAPAPAALAADPDSSPTTVQAPNPTGVASNFQATLRHLHLWSTVEVSGNRLDVRSGSCADPQLAPTIERARTSLHAAGLTRLRCVEESGHVVFDRDL